MLPVSKILGYVRKEALERLVTTTGHAVDEETVGWVLTVPAIWDDEAKAFMRKAAHAAGLIAAEDSSRLILALEPEGAAIASMLGAAPAARARFCLGERVLVMDCGGGTVDVTVSEIRSEAPLQLKEILHPSGGPWGGTYVDMNFVQFVNELLGPDAAAVDASARIEVEDAWEAVKVRGP
jgi:molecular chaperone DnaK (HSP70)